MYKICKRCGQPIKINKDSSDVFEDMHWLCFHMEFEHGEYDTDEACDDPSCPWNRISGNSLKIIHSFSDIKILGDNCFSGIFMNKKEIENYRMPSIKFDIIVFDEYLKEYTDEIWIEKEKLQAFNEQLIEIWNTGRGEALLKAMSEEDFTLRITSIDSRGHIVVIYKVKSYKYVESFRLWSCFESGFQLELIKLEGLINGIKKIIDMFQSDN
jgi:hypothetical protein